MQNYHSNLSPDQSLDSAEDQARLQELREAWGVSANGPFLVIGRLIGKLRDDLPDIFFMSDLTHPTDSHGLVYPQENPRSGSNAFVLRSDIKNWLSPEEAVSGEYWAIGELKLAPLEERERRNNPHECNVRAGTLRLLSALPPEWQIEVRGLQNAPLIADFARVEIEAVVREEILRDDAELAKMQDRNFLERQRIEAVLLEQQDRKNREI